MGQPTIRRDHTAYLASVSPVTEGLGLDCDPISVYSFHNQYEYEPCSPVSLEYDGTEWSVCSQTSRISSPAPEHILSIEDAGWATPIPSLETEHYYYHRQQNYHRQQSETCCWCHQTLPTAFTQRQQSHPRSCGAAHMTPDGISIGALPDVDSPVVGSVMLAHHDYPFSPPGSATPEPQPDTFFPGITDSDHLFMYPVENLFGSQTPATSELGSRSFESTCSSPISSTIACFPQMQHIQAREEDTTPAPGEHTDTDDAGDGAEKELRCWDHGCDGRKFSTRGNLVRHQREKANRQSFYCYNCGACFSRTTARDKHLLNQSCSRIRRYSNGRIRPKYAKMLLKKAAALAATGAPLSPASTATSAGEPVHAVALAPCMALGDSVNWNADIFD